MGSQMPPSFVEGIFLARKAPLVADVTQYEPTVRRSLRRERSEADDLGSGDEARQVGGAFVEHHAREDQEVEGYSPHDTPAAGDTHQSAHGVGARGVEGYQFKTEHKRRHSHGFGAHHAPDHPPSKVRLDSNPAILDSLRASQLRCFGTGGKRGSRSGIFGGPRGHGRFRRLATTKTILVGGSWEGWHAPKRVPTGGGQETWCCSGGT
jgi:hypothetical protein